MNETAQAAGPSRPSTYMPITILDGIRASGFRTPDKVALAENGRLMTYAALIERVDRVSHAAEGGWKLPPAGRTALLMPNGMDVIPLILGLSQAGRSPALVPANVTPAELAHICNDVEADALFVHPSLAATAGDAGLSCPIVNVGTPAFEDVLSQARGSRFAGRTEEWDTFIISYTSGTSGKPKGCLIPHRSRVIGLYTIAAEYGAFTPEDRGLAATPLYTGAGLAHGLAPLFFGGFSEIMPRFDPEQALAHLRDGGITNCFMVPTQLRAITDRATALPRKDMPMKALISGGAPLPEETKVAILDTFGETCFHELHGSNETGYVSNLRPRDQRRKQRCVGQAYAGVEIRIVNPAGQDVAPQEIGEILVRSPMLFNGYWRRPEATAEAIRDGYVTVGDLGYRDEEGYLYLAGRKSEMIISGGTNVYPAEVEEVLASHPGVAEAAVFSVADPYWGEAVQAAVVAKPGAALAPEELRQFCRTRLSGAKVPKHVLVLASLPRNPGGKVVKSELRALAAR